MDQHSRHLGSRHQTRHEPHSHACIGQGCPLLFPGSGYRFLPILPAHAEAVEDLPLHHQDPFDRILIAQAIVEPMRLLTHDRMMARYTSLAVEV